MSLGVGEMRRWWVGTISTILCATSLTAFAQAPEATSPAKAKELVTILQQKKLEAFAARDTEAGRFIAVLLVPNVQLLLVSAGYERPMDVEYRLYTKDFMNAYVELNSSVLSKDKVFFEDALADGLSPKPVNGVSDTVTIAGKKFVFNGDFTDPKKKPDPKKPSQDEYFKTFTDADARYTRLISVLLDELKKSAPAVGAAGELR